PEVLTPFDAAMWIRDVALAPLGKTWRWELASYRPAALAICEVGGELRVIATARTGGIEIALFPDAVGAKGALLVADSPARLVELAQDIAAATRRAIAARETFAARAFGIHHACALLAPQLRGMRAPRIDEHYPAWPRAWFVDERDGVTIVWLEESADGC